MASIKHKEIDYRVDGDTAFIRLHCKNGTSVETAISVSDLPRVMQHHAQFYPHTVRGEVTYSYTNVYRNGKRTYLSLHRFVLGEPDGYVDHIDHDRLNNRRANLRVVTQSINGLNRKSRNINSAQQFRGVRSTSWGKYEARLNVAGRQQSRIFSTADEAKRFIDAKLKELGVSTSPVSTESGQ